jgi:hypothetical protein
MMSKVAIAGRVYRSFGLTGVAYKVLGKMRILVGQAWLKNRLIYRYSPYTDDLWKTMKCPHCRRCLETAPEGLVCHICEDVFI